MKIRMEFFSVYREAVGKKEIEITLKKSLTINELIQKLIDDYPMLNKFIKFAIFSLNQEYARGDEILKDGDNVAIFPPIGGG